MAQRSLAAKPSLQNPVYKEGTNFHKLSSNFHPTPSPDTHSIHDNHVRYLGGVGHSFCDLTYRLILLERPLVLF